MTTGRDSRFWRNVVLIALAHVALIAGLIRWSLAASASSNPESIVWLGGAGGLAAGESESEPSSPPRHASPPEAPKPSNEHEEDEKKPAVLTANSEIELPSPTPKPTPTAASAPKPAATATPKLKATPKPIPKPTPKKTLVAKASPKPSPKAKPSSEKTNEKSEKNEKSAQTSPDRSGQSAVSGGGSSASEFGWYGNMLHDRFYSAWIQPTTHVPTGAKISTLVKVRIEKDGHVSKFEIIKPSENAVVNESVAAVAKQVTEVDSPPAGLIKGDHYDVKINFELNTEEGP
jgi:outer membrane biosynthesis protein TonB